MSNEACADEYESGNKRKNMDKRYILFDLDGTLTDSYEGIVNALKYCLSKYGIEPKPESFGNIIGPPVIWSLKTFYNIEGEQAMEALKYFREYYDKQGYLENKLYPGVEEMLKTLVAHDKKLLLATSKPEIMAHKVIEHFGLEDYFCFIAGSTAENESDRGYVDTAKTAVRSTKEDVIGYALKTNDILDPEHAVMVGDRVWDIKAAKQFGLQTIGVSYGYAEPGELEQAGADQIAAVPMQLVEMIVQS